MSKKSWRNRGQVIATQPRKFNWKPHKIFNTYELASEEKNRLLESGNKHIHKSFKSLFGMKCRIRGCSYMISVVEKKGIWEGV